MGICEDYSSDKASEQQAKQLLFVLRESRHDSTALWVVKRLVRYDRRKLIAFYSK